MHCILVKVKSFLILFACPDFSRWPNGIVPYTISTNYGEREKKFIIGAINEFHKKTCVRFVAYDPALHSDYLFLTPQEDECSSYVGRRGLGQVVNLGMNCFPGPQAVIHELNHAIGFVHEHCQFSISSIKSLLPRRIRYCLAVVE